MTKYNLEYLEEKLGTFQKEYEYPTKPISGFNLIYIETETKKELDETVKKVKEEINPGYIWGYVKDTKAIYVSRAFGENKIFIYNPTTIKKTDYVKGKLKILNNLTLNSINDLFDQRAVFDYFYRKLWDLRLELGKEIRKKNDISDNKAIMAAQHIIDRIIFTYFICEKELVTLNGQKPLDSKTLFGSITKMPDPWKCLKNLFFEQFAKKESKPLLFGKNAQIVTPYLNGGLFRPKNIGKISEIDLKIDYTRDQWHDLFEHLNKYTWIIEDKIPDHQGEYEGNLTPEIIGHIYEKFVITMETLDEIDLEELKISKSGDLKKGNKKIGAYYTPEHITEYITRSTIEPKIYRKLEIKYEKNFLDFIQNSDSDMLNKALELLNDINICDPACGSGAFLIKAGEILLEYKSKILKQLKTTEINRYALKRDIITKNLYGVDIQEGAVEICKLRLWLWLISSSNDNKVEPLPNIEYNFVVGNSLVGWTNETLDQNVLVQVDKTVLTILDALKLHYKSENIDLIKEKLQKTDMQSYAEAMTLLKNIYSYSTEDEAEQLKNIIIEIKKVIYKQIDRIFYDHLKNNGLKISQKEYENYEPFHWKVDFNSIFKDNGFDVVVGNPPYISTSMINTSERKFFRNKYTTSGKEMNTFSLFMERSFSLLKDSGMFSFIIPDSLLTVKSYIKLRKLILNQTKIHGIVNIPGGAFEDAELGNSTIIAFEKNKSIDLQNTIKTYEYVTDNSKESVLRKIDDIKQFFYCDTPENMFYLKLQSMIFLKKLKKGCVLLSEICELKDGIKTGNNKKFVLDKKTQDKHQKLLIGKDIFRYAYEFNNRYVFYDRELLSGPRQERIFLADEKIITRQTGDSITATYDDEQYYTLDSTHIILPSDDSFSVKYILSLINSKLIDYYYKLLVPEEGRTYAQVRIVNLEKLPIYPANAQEQQDLSKKVDTLLQHNKNLLEAVSDFNGWLKSTFNIQKFSQKLKRYYELDFDDFIVEVRKQKVDVKSITTYQTLKEEYKKSISVINPIMDGIQQTENDINLMVYELYGLTDDEIHLIEESLKN